MLLQRFHSGFLSLSNLRKVKDIACLSSYALQYKRYGDPNDMLEKVEIEVCENLEPTQVLFKVLAAPINPADINMVQGKYALLPKLPAVGGNEGVVRVLKVGSAVKTLKEGSWAIPNIAGLGTWKTHGVSDEKDLVKVDETLPLMSAATFTVNPCTAYRMLKDFEPLEEGSTVIQNGSNSGVGQSVIQIAKSMKVNTINVVRDRPNLESLKSYLTSLGATFVVAENELRSPVMTDIFKKIPKPSLAFNCVGGKSAAELIRHMNNKGTIVTYGGMSKLPITLSTACLIFNDIRVRGFWNTRWNEEHSKEERASMYNDLTAIIKSGGLKPPVTRQVKFDNFKEAVAKSMEPFTSEKQVLVME